jgi:hypothetical protein
MPRKQQAKQCSYERRCTRTMGKSGGNQDGEIRTCPRTVFRARTVFVWFSTAQTKLLRREAKRHSGHFRPSPISSRSVPDQFRPRSVSPISF